MTCYHPIKAYKVVGKTTERGKSVIVFSASIEEERRGEVESLELPCSQCIGCRMDQSRQWTIRLMHEASMQEEKGLRNCLVTLTYEDRQLPKGGTLVPEHFSKFIRELRRNEYPARIRYFVAGEYGDQYGRPHYHAAIYGFDFPDKMPWKKSQSGAQSFRSPELERLWTYGNSELGRLEWKSAAYISRYVLKKLNSGPAFDKYLIDFDVETGECECLHPEYIRMSNRPGIGKGWYEKYKDDCYPKDFVTYDGKRFKVPKYYDRLFDIEDPATFETIADERKKRAERTREDRTRERLASKEKKQLRRLAMKGQKRSFEDDIEPLQRLRSEDRNLPSAICRRQ